jgi:hypothetical protein
MIPTRLLKGRPVGFDRGEPQQGMRDAGQGIEAGHIFYQRFQVAGDELRTTTSMMITIRISMDDADFE